MKPPKKTASKSLIKIAQNDTSFRRWADGSNSGNIESMSKDKLMKLYRSYLKELESSFPAMRSDMMGMSRN